MPSTLQSKSTIIYNGVTFPTSSSVKVSAFPVYDSANRTEKYIRYSVTIDCIFARDEFQEYVGVGQLGQVIEDGAGNIRGHLQLSEATGRIDEGFAGIRKLLVEPGRKLTLTWAGVGDEFIIKNSDTVDFGPKPSIALMEPIGSTRAIHVVWQCEATVCDYFERTLGKGPNAWGDWAYEVNFSFSSEGLTVKTLTGVLEARVRRSIDETGLHIDNSAEGFMDLISFPLDSRFRRNQSYHISKDKRFLHYTITDSEIPSDNPYYPGCVQMDVRHRISNNLIFSKYQPGKPAKFESPGMWQISLSGTITVAPNVPRSTAWMAFKEILQQRLAESVHAGQINNKGGFVMVPFRFSIEEDIFGRSISFNTSWTMSCSLATILRASGMWEPTLGTWSVWKTSPPIVKVHRTRGFLGKRHSHNLDVICNFDEGTPSIVGGEDLPAKQPEIPYPPIFTCPPADKSFLYYDSDVEVLYKGGTIAPVKLGSYASGGNIAMDAQGKAVVPVTTGSGSSDSDTAVVQRRSIGTWTLRFSGVIIRVGHPLLTSNIPTVTKVGGKNAIRLDGGFSLPRKVVGMIADCPIYIISWSHLYQIETPRLVNVVVANEPQTWPTVAP